MRDPLASVRRGWWLTDEPPTALVIVDGAPAGVLAGIEIPGDMDLFRMPLPERFLSCIMVEAGPVVQPPMPIVELRRLAPAVFEVRLLDGAQLEDCKWFYPVVGRLPQPAIFLAIKREMEGRGAEVRHQILTAIRGFHEMLRDEGTGRVN